VLENDVICQLFSVLRKIANLLFETMEINLKSYLNFLVVTFFCFIVHSRAFMHSSRILLHKRNLGSRHILFAEGDGGSSFSRLRRLFKAPRLDPTDAEVSASTNAGLQVIEEGRRARADQRTDAKARPLLKVS